jgi:hypothetical protein
MTTPPAPVALTMAQLEELERVAKAAYPHARLCEALGLLEKRPPRT